MKVIPISAYARHGKDFTANIIKEELENQGHSVLICHYADLLKYICKTFFGWNGKKDDEGRTTLQYVGTDVIRKQNPDYWVSFIESILNMFSTEWEYVLIPDFRFPNEADKLKEDGFDVCTLRVTRPNFDNGLTEEQKNHPSEIALDDYHFNYRITNNGTKEGLRGSVIEFIGCLNNEVI